MSVNFQIFKNKSFKKSFRFFLVTLILLLSSLTGINIEAQPAETSKTDKSKLTIKPNSRDMNVVLRDNTMQRVDRQRQKAVQKKMQQLRQQKAGNKRVNQARRKEMIQRRNQMIQQRNSKRR
jgi:hypothetical protein